VHVLGGPASVIVGVVGLDNPSLIARAANVLRLGAVGAAPVVAGTTVEQNATPENPQEQPAPVSATTAAPTTGGATIGQQLIAKTALAQQQKAKAAGQLRPGLPFHPGQGVPHP
jgi:hypothetical protein